MLCAYRWNVAFSQQAFKHEEQFRPDTVAGKFRGRIQSLQPIAVNCAPRDCRLIQLGNPYLHRMDLPRHSGNGQISGPDFGLRHRHSLWCECYD